MIRLATSGKVESKSLPFFLYYSRTPSGARNALAEEANPDVRRMTAGDPDLEEYLPEKLYPGSALGDHFTPSTMGGNQFPSIHLRRSIPRAPGSLRCW